MIKPHAPALVRSRLLMAKSVIKNHFGKNPRKVEFKPAGLTNFVFEADLGDKKKYIVRIGGTAEKLTDFLKEQWVINKVMREDVPVAKVLEVGAEVIPYPYMIQEKLNGEEAIHHTERLDILFDMGVYTKKIHSIATTSYGSVFDWSKNNFNKNFTWKDFLHNEWRLNERLQLLNRHKLIEKSKIRKITTAITKIEKWKDAPSLNHGDIRLKNVIVNDKGKILALIDWEHSLSAIAPYWDLSIALHDLSVDAKHRFLEGYGMDPREFEQSAFVIKLFNILNYTPALEQMILKKDRAQLALYRLRLNGYLDLYSI